MYLSRSRLAETTFTNADETELEGLLSEFGVQIVHPEALSLQEQIELFNRHSVFIGLQGSAFHNKIWCLRPLTCFMLSPYINENYFLFDAVKGGVSHYGAVFLPREPAAGAAGLGLRTDWAALADWLQLHGLLRPDQAARVRDKAVARATRR